MLESVLKKAHIIAPVASMEMCQAAVHNGADAVYLGMPGFNARAKAKTFSLEELKEIIDFCHLYSVKVAVCVNILVFEDELAQLASLLVQVLKLGPDSFVVQDIGVARLIKYLAPQQKIFASTQMTILDSAAIKASEDLGFARYILGREVSLEEMRAIRAKTDKELEVFVHGALCISYSGQCLYSENHGGRSANRGQCAQVCRLPFELYVDGERRPLAGNNFLFSPHDLCALKHVPELMQAGVDAFKIEGRLKPAHYVASAVRAFRDCIDKGGFGPEELAARERELALIFSRGFCSGFLQGANHKTLIDGQQSGHRGVVLGEVLSVAKNRVLVKLHAGSAASDADGSSNPFPLEAGQGAVFFTKDNSKRVGANIYEVSHRGGAEYALAFARDFDLKQIEREMLFSINAAPSLEKRIKLSYSDKSCFKKIGLRAAVWGQRGESLSLKVVDDAGREVVVKSKTVLDEAKKAALTKESLLAELGALGGTAFKFLSFECSLGENVFLHQRELKEMRRAAVEQLTQMRQQPAALAVVGEESALRWVSEKRLPEAQESCEAKENAPSLNVLVRDISQLDALQDLEIATVYLDLPPWQNLKQAVLKVKEYSYRAAVATPRVQKEGQARIFEGIVESGAEAVLVRNLSALHYFKDSGLGMLGDFSLNATNSLTLEWLLKQNLQRVCPSFDLDADQLVALLKNAAPHKLEFCLYHYMPLFYMEHCLFAAKLGAGCDHRSCGKPCKNHRIELQDYYGERLLLKVDSAWRNTVFSSKARCMAQLLPALQQNALKAFRVEALDESAEVLRKKLELFGALIKGKRTLDESLAELNLL